MSDTTFVDKQTVIQADWLQDVNDLTYKAGALSNRSALDKINDVVSVKDFGAIGDGVTDDSASIQAAVTYSNSNQVPIYFPTGTYKCLTSINIPGKVTLFGTYGFNNSVLVGYDTSIFNFTSLDDSLFEGLTFQGATAGVTAFKQTVITNYTSNTTWNHCVFFYSLTECIYANLILCTIEDNNFGYYGPSAPSQVSHRHIYSQGDSVGGNVTNINRILNNRFYNATAAESCFFESGNRLQIWGNDFETNQARALTLKGMSSFDIRDNWFENNDDQFVMLIANNTTGTLGNYATVIEDNFFTTQYNGGYIADITGTSIISSFSRNTGSGLWYEVTPSNVKILKSEDNYFLGTMALPINTSIGITGVDFKSATSTINSNISGTATEISFNVGSASAEKSRITSNGTWYIGTTSYAAGQNAIQLGTSAGSRAFSVNTTATVNQILFDNPNGSVGSIQTSGTTTSYGTSSDYRLKENVQPLKMGLSRILALKPCKYTWKVDGTYGEGFIAHELQEIFPACVSGIKDATSEKGVPIYQSIDTSFMIGALVASIQEQQKQIQELSTKINLLESK